MARGMQGSSEAGKYPNKQPLFCSEAVLLTAKIQAEGGRHLVPRGFRVDGGLGPTLALKFTGYLEGSGGSQTHEGGTAMPQDGRWG